MNAMVADDQLAPQGVRGEFPCRYTVLPVRKQTCLATVLSLCFITRFYVPRKFVSKRKAHPPPPSISSHRINLLSKNIPASAPGVYFGFRVYSLWSIHRLIGEDDRWDVSSVVLKDTPSRFIPLEGYLIGYDREYFSCITKSINGHAIAMVEHRFMVIVWCGKTQRRWAI